MPAKQWLLEILRSRVWHPETIALFLRRQGKGGLPTQNLNSCLHEAIQGSPIGRQRELTEALILLIEAGADVYARDNFGRTVSEIACCKKTKWYNGSWIDIKRVKRRLNRDLRLKEIWMDVLSECGYDPEKVISASVQVEEPFDSDNDSSFYSYKDIYAAASGYSEGDSDNAPNQDIDNDNTSDQEWESDVAADDVIARQPDAVLPHHYENLLLEGDAEVWSS